MTFYIAVLSCTPPAGYSGGGDIKYKLFTNTQTYYDAWTQCQSDAARLPTLKDYNENGQFWAFMGTQFGKWSIHSV